MSSFALLQPCTSSLRSRPQTGIHQHDDVYTRLLDAIVEQRILPDSRLSEDALAQKYGASRSHVREALSRLSYQQLVTVHPNARARVAAPTNEQIRQALHARRLTEMALIPWPANNLKRMTCANYTNCLRANANHRPKTGMAPQYAWQRRFISTWQRWPGMRHWRISSAILYH